MSSKQEYQQQLQAQLDEWQADVDRLRAKVSTAITDVHPEMDERIEELKRRIEAGQTQLAELAKASDDGWKSMKDDIESAVFHSSADKSNS
ncbi:MAG: hypothetical protein R6W76_19805 [Caldilinea sp.]